MLLILKKNESNWDVLLKIAVLGFKSSKGDELQSQQNS